MDFARAFDKVPHRRLFHKLEYYGIRGSTHKWINSWLSGRTQQVVLDGQASDPVPVLSGVPQGSVLGPVLFRSQRSCKIQLVQFAHNIISNLDGAVNRGHKETDLIIMDFARAFDKVPHRRLFHKLEYYGIRGSTHKWINLWLSGRTQHVVLDGQASDPVPVLSGVPQGSVLGPVLFLIFINDLLDNIRSSVRLFADDCVLYRNIHSLQDCLALQEDLTS